MKVSILFLYKTFLLFVVLVCAFTTQKTVTIVVGNRFYSSSSNYRTLHDLSKHAPFPFSKLQSANVPNQMLYEGFAIRWNDGPDEP